jgi:hypothetical protein
MPRTEAQVLAADSTSSYFSQGRRRRATIMLGSYIMMLPSDVTIGFIVAVFCPMDRPALAANS